jgi:hypothetical protein
MTQNIFNLYATTVFAEHPTGLWSLDEDFSFISLVSGSPSWSIVNGTSASVANLPPTKPQETVGVSDIELDLESFQASASVMTLKTQNFIVPTDIDPQKPTVCIHTFIYSYDANITKCEIGFELNSIRYSTIYENLKEEDWTRVFHTMDLPVEGVLNPFVELTFAGLERTISFYKFSVGQWSEQYNHESIGTVPIPLSSISASAALQSSINGIWESNPEKIKVSIADNYGFAKRNDGYYVVEDNKMLVVNSKLPMVFGSGDITEIKFSPSGGPSLVFPGKGFFHQDGKFQDLTAEFWLKINPQTTEAKKIFGPVSSDDGLYVEDRYLTMKLGPYEKSYFIHKWYRPMLISFRYTPFFVSLLINGDVVAQQEILPRDVEFPDSSIFNNDWIAFYGHEEIPQFEIDCFAIYPYAVPEQSAKRKFVYGQGVGTAEEVAKKFGGDSVSIDFPFAEYTKNIIYPDMTKWYSGFYSNVEADSKFITLPQYSPPELVYVGEDLTPFNIDRSRRTWGGLKTTSTWSQWITSQWRRISQSKEIDPEYDNYFLQTNNNQKTFIKIKPTPGYQNLFGSLNFPSMNPIGEQVNSVLGVFSINESELLETNETKMMLMHFKNNANGNVFQIVLDKTGIIQYIYNQTVVKEQNFTFTSSDKEFVVGIKIDDFSKSYATIVRNFFSNPQNVQFNVGGIEKNTFPGKIYKVVFNNTFFTRKDMLSYYSSDGVAIYNDETINQNIFEYIGNYTMLLKKTNESVIIDVGVAGYWEDSIPFSSFASFVENAKGTRVLYDVDMLQFNIDYPAPITNKTNFDTQDNIKTFVSIQSFEDVGGISYLTYNVTKPLDEKRYVNFDTVQTNINNTKFRVIDGTVIFPPKKIISFDKAYLTIHLEMSVDGINIKPTQVQRMSLASLAFDESKLYAISSPTGRKIYPFTRQGGTYSSKTKNPFVIQKESAPYLYLTGDSGIQVLPYPDIEDFNPNNFFRGLSIPINQSKKEGYVLYGFHTWMFYNRNTQFEQKELMFSLSYPNKRYNFYLEPEVQNKRAKVIVYEDTITGEQLTTDFDTYENGIKKQVYIYPQSWILFTAKLKPTANLSNIVGQFEISPGILIKNFTAYEIPIDKRVDDIFESHLGLSNIVAQDSSTLLVNSEGLTIFSDIKSTVFDGKSV